MTPVKFVLGTLAFLAIYFALRAVVIWSTHIDDYLESHDDWDL